MGQSTAGFSLDTLLLRKRIEKRRRESKDARLHVRLSALLWLDKGYCVEEVADLLGVCPRTIRNWLELFRKKGLDGLCTLEYKGDPG
jgi:transposase